MPDNLKSLLENPTFERIDEPVALYFSYVDTDRYAFYQDNKEELVNLHNLCRDDLIVYLQEKDYTAVSDENPLAAHPGTIVVSHSGIQTPFFSQNYAKKFAMDLAYDIAQSHFAQPLSKIFAIRLEQLPAPVLYDTNEKSLFTYLKHPDGRIHNFIRFRYGKDFINQQFKQAWSLGDDNSLMKKYQPNPEDLNEPLYSGRKLAIDPFYSYARNDLESRYQVFATPHYVHAAKFCGGDELFGLIHHYQKAKGQLYFKSYDLEAGGVPQSEAGKQIETAVVPGLNPYLGLEMYMKTRSFIIPEDQERWIVFKEFCRAAYIPANDNLKQRRINILTQAKQNGGNPVCYMPVGISENDLSLDNFQLQKPQLEYVLIEPLTPIRKQYFDFLTAMKHHLDTVRKIKNPKDKMSSDHAEPRPQNPRSKPHNSSHNR